MRGVVTADADPIMCHANICIHVRISLHLFHIPAQYAHAHFTVYTHIDGEQRKIVSVMTGNGCLVITDTAKREMMVWGLHFEHVVGARCRTLPPFQPSCLFSSEKVWGIHHTIVVFREHEQRARQRARPLHGIEVLPVFMAHGRRKSSVKTHGMISLTRNGWLLEVAVLTPREGSG